MNNDVSKQKFLHDREAAALSPLLQALISGVFFSLALYGILNTLHVLDDWKIALISCPIVWLMVWTGLQMRWLNLISFAERLTGWDLPGNDGIELQATTATETMHTVKVDIHEVQNGGYVKTTSARFQATDHVMRELAQGLLDGRPFTEAEWTGRGKLLSKPKFIEIREEMERRRLIKLRSPNFPQQGFELTKSGQETMRQIADSPTPGE